jgi:hypothetical protein
MSRQQLRRLWMRPLVFFQLYLSTTVLLFFFGPWPWNVDDPLLLATYLLAAQGFIAAGYLMAWRRVRWLHGTGQKAVRHVATGISYLRWALLISFVLLIPTSLSRTGSVLPNIFFGLSDVGFAYNQNFERLEGGNAFVMVEYLRMLFAPFLVAVFPLTVVYWSQLSIRLKVLCLVVIIFNLSLYIATGTNKGFADIVITLPMLMFLSVSAGILRLRFRRHTLVIAFVVLLAGFLQFFGIGQIQRIGGVGEFGVFNTGLGLIEADSANAASQFLTDNLRIIFESLVRYLTTGYYALSLGFSVEHASTFGLGHSMFTARNADAIFETSHFTWGSIPGLLELQSNFGMFTLWHSIYPWIASDVGFVGTLFVMGIFGYLLGLSWGYSLLTLSPKWVTLLYLLLILFFYIPANNQIFQSGETFMAFLLILTGLAFSWSTRSTSLRKPITENSKISANRSNEGVKRL